MQQILVVDDDPANLRIIIHMLEGAGYSVSSAQDGCVAFTMWWSFRHNLIICDWKMPRLDGVQLHSMIYTEDRSQAFILVSAEKKPPSGWSNLFLRKPFSKIQLLKAVEQALGGRSQTPPRANTPPPGAPPVPSAL